MKALLAIVDNSKFDLLQLIKMVVYVLLLINFFYYIWDDWVIASFTMRNGGTFLEWTSAFAVSIDESAWIVLIVLFELETYALSDEAFTRTRVNLMHGARIVCYGFLAHTLYAYGTTVSELSSALPIEGVTNLCQLVVPEASFVFNLAYTDLNVSNCSNLSTAAQFFYTEPPETLVVTDPAGLLVELRLAWVDLIEALVWLLILLTIEVVVRLQDKGVSGGALIKGLNASKVFLYTLLWGAIFYWLYGGHIVYAWDEFVWIAGFVAIEMNVAEWRQEIIETDAVKESPAGSA